MTAKRFYVDYRYNRGDLWDRRNGCLLQDFGKHIASECTLVVDMLNNLNEENEQLRKDSTVLILANQDYRKENEQLKEENEKLHDEIFRLRTELAYDRTVNDGKDWFKVEDEHLKLKSTLDKEWK